VRHSLVFLDRGSGARATLALRLCPSGASASSVAGPSGLVSPLGPPLGASGIQPQCGISHTALPSWIPEYLFSVSQYVSPSVLCSMRRRDATGVSTLLCAQPALCVAEMPPVPGLLCAQSVLCDPSVIHLFSALCGAETLPVSALLCVQCCMSYLLYPSVLC
jgi:hypothetical protein